MYKDKEKQREAVKRAVQKHRGITEGITEGITPQGITDLSGDTQDLLDKLTDPIWRGRLEKICRAFESSHHPSYSDTCFLGNYELPLVCELLEVTNV